MAAVLLALSGAGLQLWCIVLFQSLGRGTPSPAFAPQKLVSEGLYALVRNPLNIGEVMLFLAIASWFASPLLLAYAALAALAFHCFIVKWEEPQHLKRFGEKYLEYRAKVNRWLPRFKARRG